MATAAAVRVAALDSGWSCCAWCGRLGAPERVIAASACRHYPRQCTARAAPAPRAPAPAAGTRSAGTSPTRRMAMAPRRRLRPCCSLRRQPVPLQQLRCPATKSRAAARAQSGSEGNHSVTQSAERVSDSSRIGCAHALIVHSLHLAALLLAICVCSRVPVRSPARSSHCAWPPAAEPTRHS